MKAALAVAGTRSEIIKMAPVIRALQRNRISFTFVHRWQHYDYNMSQQFIRELELPTPSVIFKIAAASPAT
ncbi:MAG: hypothetical protein QXL10_05355 [Candidatus Bathyarchaeia archaeon]